MPQAFVSQGGSPSACRRADSRLPAEKHSVPASANARPCHVPAEASWREAVDLFFQQGRPADAERVRHNLEVDEHRRSEQ